MPEENTTVSSGAMSNDAAPQGEMPTTPATSEMQDATTPQLPDAVQKELADLRAALKKANTDAKENRLAKEELKRLKDEAESAKLSETERLQKELATLKAQHEELTQAQTERAIKSEVALEAAKLGVDPNVLDKVARFLDWEEIDVDEQGHPTNIRALVEQLVKDIPGLKSKSAQASSGGATNPPRSTTSQPTEITASYVADVMSGKVPWATLTPEQRTAILNWQAKNSYRF